MPIFEGPRREVRRIVHEGRIQWARPEGSDLLLPDGRRIGADVIHLAPCSPSKIVCIHLNYESRRQELSGPEFPVPTYFLKPPSSLNGHRGAIPLPSGCRYLNYEGEIAVVVGTAMRNVRREDVWDHVAGLTIANDVGLHDFREGDLGSMLRVKGQDGFCPLGPGLVSGVDIRESQLVTRVNGRIAQQASVSEMLFDIDYLLADMCRYITLEPGDVILTGTPANSRPMAPGDEVAIEVSGIGRLENRVIQIPEASERIGQQPTDSAMVRSIAIAEERR